MGMFFGRKFNAEVQRTLRVAKESLCELGGLGGFALKSLCKGSGEVWNGISQ